MDVKIMVCNDNKQEHCSASETAAQILMETKTL